MGGSKALQARHSRGALHCLSITLCISTELLGLQFRHALTYYEVICGLKYKFKGPIVHNVRFLGSILIFFKYKMFQDKI